MKSKNPFTIAKAAMTLLFAMLTTTAAWAQGQLPPHGTGTEADPYQIERANDWNNLADYVAAGNTCSGLFFQMTDDIGTTENPITKPLGRQVGKNKTTDRRRFAGTFDGGNHTLTVNITNVGNNWFEHHSGYCSPFAYTQYVTISNLHVTGTITTTGQFASGLVGQAGADGDKNDVCSITNCHVSVNFVGNTAGSNVNGNHGTFVGVAEGTVNITNSWFDGALTGSNYLFSGGFIGLNKKQANFTDCLFNPSEVSITNNNIGGSQEFAHNNNGGKSSLTRCYYTKSFSAPENAQGTKVVENKPNTTEYSYTPVTAADNKTYYIITGNNDWTAIQTAINGTDTEYTLTKNITAGTNDFALVVPNDKTFTLNLGGFTLDRGLDIVAAQDDGYVINNQGTLTITNGTIRGGNNKGNGGGIYNDGTLTLNGTTITGNYATSNGSGVYNLRTLRALGNVYITGNSKGNVYLGGDDKNIHVDGALGNSSIGVTRNAYTGYFTSGLSGNGTLNNFSSDDTNLSIILFEGEARLFVSLDENDNTNAIANKNGKTVDVILNDRTLYKDGAWNTLCLPFALTSTQLAASPLAGAEIRSLTSASLTGETLNLTFSDPIDAINPGTPYLIKWASGTNLVSPVFSGVIINKNLVPSTSSNVSFKGTYNKIEFSANNENILILGDNNKLYHPGDNGFNLKPQRAYFELSVGNANVKSFALTFKDGDEDDITMIRNEKFDLDSFDNSCYDLFGRMVANPVKGNIYIVNGKKVMF